MKDTLSYSARWDSVGIDCAFCKHQNDVAWPNIKRDYVCKLHKISLAVTVAKNGFKEGEWFCSKYESNGKANENALNEFSSFRDKLASNILYGAYGKDGNLKEIPFSQL